MKQPKTIQLPSRAIPTIGEAITSLLEEGVTPVIISKAFNIPLLDLINLGVPVSRDSDDLPSVMQYLEWEGAREGLRLLQVGSPAIKLRLVSSIFAHSMKLANTRSSTVIDELRSMLETLVADTREPVEDPNPKFIANESDGQEEFVEEDE